LGTLSDPDIESGSAGGGIKNITNAKCILDLYDDRMQTITNTYELIGFTPENMGEITMSNANPAIAYFQASFRYQYWKTSKTNFKA
jgi:hypothetical protein